MREQCHRNRGAGGAPTHVNPPAAVKYQETLAGIENVRGHAGAEAESAIGSGIIGAEARGMQNHTTAMRGHVMKKDGKNGHVRKGLAMKGPGMKDLVTTGPVRIDHVMTGPVRIDNGMTGPVRIDHAMTDPVRKGHEMMDHAVTGHVKTGLEMIECERRSWSAVKKAQVTVTVRALNAVGITTALENIPHTIIEHHHGRSVPSLP